MEQANLELKIGAGDKLRDKGIKRALAHADREITGWAADAYQALLRYPEKRFQSSEVRHWAHANGLSLPPDGRAWGGVFTRAKNNKVIIFVGYEPDKDRKSHSSPANVWERV